MVFYFAFLIWGSFVVVLDFCLFFGKQLTLGIHVGGKDLEGLRGGDESDQNIFNFKNSFK